MKLRIRSIATKETISITITDTSSLRDLKTLIATSLANASTNPNPIAPDSIHLSLNRTDELLATNASDPLSSLGLTSGDLLFFSFSPFPKTLINSNPPLAPNSVPPVSSSGTKSSSDNPIVKSSSDNPIGNPNKGTTVKPSPINLSVGPMEVDAAPAVLKASDNTLGFLVKLMETDTGEDAGILGQVVLLTHAAILDMGFTLINGSGPNLPQGWASQAPSLCLNYTISDFGDQVQAINEKVGVLKFSVLGNLVTIYGYVSGVKPDFYRFCFDLAKFALLFSSNLNSLSKTEQDQLMEVFHGVKDSISLPLMMDLCLKNGLPLPPCFMVLSVDMKSKILDLLPGVDAVRMGSTCKEMWNLSLDENMWRQKMEREFSSSLNDIQVLRAGSWREKYKRAYISKQNALRFQSRQSYRYQSGSAVRRRPFDQHFFVGGDADRFPALGPGFGGSGPGYFLGRVPAGRQVVPRCDFGELEDSSMF
jgi:F-box protein 7